MKLDEVAKLDAGRTQGDWISGVHPANHNMNIINPIMFGSRVGKLPECEGSHAYFKKTKDSQFIAASPNFAKMLLKLRDEKLVEMIAKVLHDSECVADFHKRDGHIQEHYRYTAQAAIYAIIKHIEGESNE